MKSFKYLTVSLITISLMLFLFYSCNMSGSKYTDDEKAALVGEAVTGSGIIADGSKSAGLKTVATVTDDYGGSIEYDDSASKADLISSAYYNDMDSWTVPPATYNSLTYNNFHVTVQDSSGNDVTVTLSGTVYWGYYFTFNLDTGIMSGIMVFYGTTSGTIYGEEFKSFNLDLEYTYSYDTSNRVFTGSIKGTVNNRAVTNNFTYTAPSAS